MTVQPSFPTLRDYREPVVVSGHELAEVLADARSHGFECQRMAFVSNARYELRFIYFSPLSSLTH